MSKHFKPTREDIDNIIKMYQSGLGMGPISKKYHSGIPKIRKILIENGIQIHIKGDEPHYRINNEFLDDLDSSNKFYFLGWMFSDGSVDSRWNTFSIGLSVVDKNILFKLNNLLGNEREVFIGDKVATLKATSKRLKERLIELGCAPNKTPIVKFPDWIPRQFLKDFIRGFFDGDGGISIKENKNGSYTGSLSFTSTKDFNEKLKEILECELGLKHIRIRNAQTSFVTILTINVREEIIKLMDWMYSDAELLLERKHEKYCLLKDNINKNSLDRSKQRLYIESKKEEIIKRYKNGESGSSIGKDLKIDKSTVCRLIKNYRLQQGV